MLLKNIRDKCIELLKKIGKNVKILQNIKEISSILTMYHSHLFIFDKLFS